MAIPLSQVGRLEELAANKVEKSGDQEVIQYRGQIMPLIRLNRQLHLDSAIDDGATPQENIQVVVYSDHGRSVGLVVENILDIVEESVTVRREARRDGHHDGLLGSAVIQGRVTDLVDVQAVVLAASGE
jgi:two-component system chemotaxis sensor kinase CheA